MITSGCLQRFLCERLGEAFLGTVHTFPSVLAYCVAQRTTPRIVKACPIRWTLISRSKDVCKWGQQL